MFDRERKPKRDGEQTEICHRPVAKRMDTNEDTSHGQEPDGQIGHHYWPVGGDGRVDQDE